MFKKSFTSGALILIVSGLIVRAMGFIYRIYLSNLIGAEGMGLFQLIFPLYSLIILTLTSGISISVSRMVAEELAKNHHANLRRIMIYGLQIVVSVSIAVALVCFAYADFISNSILKDWRTYYSLVLLIPCIPIIAAASALKGYFYGIQEMIPTAISQIVEQIVRIGFVMLTASWFLEAGLEYACAVATFGTALGEIANLIVLYSTYRFGKQKIGKSIQRSLPIKKKKVYKELIVTSMPISFSRFITSALGAVETILIPARLMAGGLSHHLAMEAFGKLVGMAMPLVFFPTVITSGLATALVPAISKSVSTKSFKAANYKISRSIQLTLALGIMFTVIFSCYPNQISNVIYRKDKIGGTLYLLSFTCVFLYLQQILIGILNGLGLQTISLWNSLIGSILRIGFVYYYIPIYGIRGYIWGIVISSAMVCVLNMLAIMKETGLLMDFKNWVFKPGIIGVVMAICSKYIYSFFIIFHVSGEWTIFMTLTANVFIAVELMMLVGMLGKGKKTMAKSIFRSLYR